MERIISKREAAARKGVSVPTWERQEAAALAAGDPDFPPRRIVGRGRVGYLESDVDQHLRTLPMGALVARTAAANAARRGNREQDAA